MRRTKPWVAVAGGLVVGLALGAAALLAQGSLASSAGPAAEAPPRLEPGALGKYFFGPQLARAEVVLVVRGAVHDFRIDRGMVKAVSGAGIDLKERDGSIVTVPVAPDAHVRVGSQETVLSAVRPGMTALTVRDGNTPASSVQASARG